MRAPWGLEGSVFFLFVCFFVSVKAEVSSDIHVEMAVHSGLRLEFQRQVTAHWQPSAFRERVGLDERRRPTWWFKRSKQSRLEGSQEAGRRKCCRRKRVVSDAPDVVTREKCGPCPGAGQAPASQPFVYRDSGDTLQPVRLWLIGADAGP